MPLTEEEKLRRKEEKRQKKIAETHKIINGIEYKYCCRGEHWIEINDDTFYKVEKNFDGLHTYCKKCLYEKSKQWALDNREKRLESQKRFNSQPRMKEYNRRYSDERRKNGKMKEWQQKNPDKIRGYNKYREQHKKHEISKDEWENCKNYFNYRCAYCELPVEEHFKMWNGLPKQIDLHKDHVDHNGANDLSNCVPSCQSCNSSKYYYELEDWYNKDNKNYTQERLDKIHKWLADDFLRFKEY